jgi:hypothetical protein
LAQVRQLNVALDKARASLATLGKFAMPTGLTVAVGETSAPKAWADVAANAASPKSAANFKSGNHFHSLIETSRTAGQELKPAAATSASARPGCPQASPIFTFAALFSTCPCQTSRPVFAAAAGRE